MKSSKVIPVVCALIFTGAVPAPAGAFKTLYSFCSQAKCTDGAGPWAGVIDINGTLYGTTGGGGANYDGMVFSVDAKTGVEKVLYSFGSQANDGAGTQAGVIDVEGILYGTTYGGGAYGGGTVFSVDANTGVETVLHSFCSQTGCGDGYTPFTGLIDVKGTLYGTTYSGGANGSDCLGNGCGTVFSVDAKTGVEKVLYSFCSQANCADGAFPFAALIDVNHALYGTTNGGGAFDRGTVFSVDAKTGVEKTLYSFGSQANDGLNPEASLIDVKGKLFGTTEFGGGANGSDCLGYGCGTVFSVDANTGVEKVLYSFCGEANCVDGAEPLAGLIDIKGMLYGTTYDGGAYGEGTVFSIDANTGAETVLYSFGSRANDGGSPLAGLIDVKGKLYGTTINGGAYDGGTVFSGKR